VGGGTTQVDLIVTPDIKFFVNKEEKTIRMKGDTFDVSFNTDQVSYIDNSYNTYYVQQGPSSFQYVYDLLLESIGTTNTFKTGRQVRDLITMIEDQTGNQHHAFGPLNTIQLSDGSGGFTGDPDFAYSTTANVLSVEGDIQATGDVEATNVVLSELAGHTNSFVVLNADGRLNTESYFTVDPITGLTYTGDTVSFVIDPANGLQLIDSTEDVAFRIAIDGTAYFNENANLLSGKRLSFNGSSDTNWSLSYNPTFANAFVSGGALVMTLPTSATNGFVIADAGGNNIMSVRADSAVKINKILGIGNIPSNLPAQIQLYVSGSAYVANAIGIGNVNPTSPIDISRSVVTNSSIPSINLIETWNTTGSPKAIFANITKTAAGAQAKLIDLQVNNTSQFNISLTGEIVATNLGGTGVRMVVADATGAISTQTIPNGVDGTKVILNQLTQQASANFNISGSGTMNSMHVNTSAVIAGVTTATVSSLTIKSTSPAFELAQSNAAANAGRWIVTTDPTNLYVRAITDAGTVGTNANVLSANRSTQDVVAIVLGSPLSSLKFDQWHVGGRC
jgi:hypothetical protein